MHEDGGLLSSFHDAVSFVKLEENATNRKLTVKQSILFPVH